MKRLAKLVDMKDEIETKILSLQYSKLKNVEQNRVRQIIENRGGTFHNMFRTVTKYNFFTFHEMFG
jgi:hypothetical protein